MQTLMPMIDRSRHNPYEISIAVALGGLSLYGLFLTPASTSLDAGLTFTQRLAYSAVGLVGATVTMIGLRCKNPHMGLEVERAGQFMLAWGSAAFVAVLCGVSTFEQSGLVTGVGASIAYAAMWRVRQINRDLKTWQMKMLSSQHDVDAALKEIKETYPEELRVIEQAIQDADETTASHRNDPDEDDENGNLS